MSKPRNKVYNFRANEYETDIIESKFRLSESDNRSDFLRKIIMYGIVVKYDEELMKNIFRMMSSAVNNLNQIYFKAKEQNSPLLAEIEIVKLEVEEVWQLLKSIQSILQKRKP